MAMLILGLLWGVGFIVLGRWIYKNPKTMYVSSLSARSDSPFREFVARLFATLLIFLGSLGAATALASLLLHRALAITLIGAAAGALGAVFLRPGLGTAPLIAARTTEPALAGRGPLLTRKGKLFLVTMIGGGVAVGAETFVLPAVGKAALTPDVALVTILIMATALLMEMLFVK